MLQGFRIFSRSVFLNFPKQQRQQQRSSFIPIPPPNDDTDFIQGLVIGIIIGYIIKKKVG